MRFGDRACPSPSGTGARGLSNELRGADRIAVGLRILRRIGRILLHLPFEIAINRFFATTSGCCGFEPQLHAAEVVARLLELIDRPAFAGVAGFARRGTSTADGAAASLASASASDFLQDEAPVAIAVMDSFSFESDSDSLITCRFVWSCDGSSPE